MNARTMSGEDVTQGQNLPLVNPFLRLKGKIFPWVVRRGKNLPLDHRIGASFSRARLRQGQYLPRSMQKNLPLPWGQGQHLPNNMN